MVPNQPMRRMPRRWLRRAAITLLVTMTTGIVGLAGTVAWVIGNTMRVVVEDSDGRPVPGAAVFAFVEVISSGAKSASRFVRTGCGDEWEGGIGALSSTTGLLGYGGRFPAAMVSPTEESPASLGTRVLRWLHRWTRPFGVALVWDLDQLVWAGGDGGVRVPESKDLIVLCAGELSGRPGEIYSVEQSQIGRVGLGPPTRIVLTPMHSVSATIATRVNWFLHDAAFSDLFRLVEAEAGVPVLIDKPSLEEEGVTGDTPITAQFHDLRLESALKLVLQEYNLTAVFNGRSILITSQLTAGNDLTTRLYPIRDLIGDGGIESDRVADELAGILEETCSPNSWKNVGGNGHIGHIVPDRCLIVRQSASVHREIEGRLHALRTGNNAPASDDAEHIERALARPISCVIQDDELQDALKTIGELSGISNIVLNKPALEEEGVTSDTPVSLRTFDRPLKLALRDLLDPLKLTFVVTNDVLMITSQLEAGNELEHRVYPVQDLLGDSRDADALIDIIEGTVALTSWSCVGGAGTIRLFTPKSLLVINQTRDFHEQVELLLSALRSGDGSLQSADDRIVQNALRKAVSFRFREIRLQDAVDQIATEIGVKNVTIDTIALAEEGVHPDTLVDLECRHISAASALRLMLGPLLLTAEARNGALRITSELEVAKALGVDVAEIRWGHSTAVDHMYGHGVGNELVSRIYPVGDLIDGTFDADSLIVAIESQVSPNSWDSVGGAGTILYFWPNQYLIVQNTSAIHAAIEQLLNRGRGMVPSPSPEDRIRESLQLIFDWSFELGTLEQLADRLSVGLDCTVVLNREQLKIAGVTPDSRITVTALNEPLETALRRALEKLGACIEARDDYLVITRNW
jgi:hypothetical protein